MQVSKVVALVIVPLISIAAPVAVLFEHLETIRETSAAPVKPKPCQPISPAPSVNETRARFDDFADKFIVKKNITGAFEYINQGYINHNPAAQNGFDSAWNILSPIWASQNIKVLGTKFNNTQGWLHYSAGSFGEVVDRYRWEAGCIAEHWDQGEKFPT